MSSNATNIIVSEIADGVGRITINRPEKRNALNRATRVAFLEALQVTATSGQFRVLIIDGAKGNFCAGMDLNEVSGGTQEEVDTVNALWLQVLEAIRNHPAIVIGAVCGYALGGGSTLIQTCDLAVVARNAQIGMPEMGFGFYPGLAASAALLRVSPKRAAWLILTAKRIDGTTAVEWGMANVVVDQSEVEAESNALARHIAQFDPIALRWSKRAIQYVPEHVSDWGAALEFGAYTNVQIHSRSNAHREALLTFAQGGHNPGQGT